jgi:hypothetical protein
MHNIGQHKNKGAALLSSYNAMPGKHALAES